MYVTDRRCVGAGPFEGPLVVSMRPFAPHDIAAAVEISSRFPMMHGGPVHVGDPGELGITDLGAPDFGDPVHVDSRCGARRSGRAASRHRPSSSEAKPPLAIFHAPGHMFITDRPHDEFDSQETAP